MRRVFVDVNFIKNLSIYDSGNLTFVSLVYISDVGQWQENVDMMFATLQL